MDKHMDGRQLGCQMDSQQCDDQQMDKTPNFLTSEDVFANAMASDPELCIRVAQDALGVELEPASDADVDGGSGAAAVVREGKSVRFNAVISMLGKVVPIKMRLHSFSSDNVQDNLIEVDAGTFGVMLNAPTWAAA